METAILCKLNGNFRSDRLSSLSVPGNFGLIRVYHLYFNRLNLTFWLKGAFDDDNKPLIRVFGVTGVQNGS